MIDRILIATTLATVASGAVTNIASRAESTCAIDGGKVKCWGLGTHGQLGRGSKLALGVKPGEIAKSAFIDLGPGLTAKLVTGGTDFHCALFTNGQVKCWGANKSGQLGLGHSSDRGDLPGQMGAKLPFVALGTRVTQQTIVSGYDHSCAINNKSKLKCWGQNDFGQLGYGDFNNRGDKPNEMGDKLPNVNFGEKVVVDSVATGLRTTCAIYREFTLSGATKVFKPAKLVCWGHNASGQCGVGGTRLRDRIPATLNAVDLGTGRTPKRVALGYSHTCAILDNDLVKCWGANENGQLGLGDLLNRGDDENEMGDVLKYVPLGTDSGGAALKVSNIYAQADRTCVVLASKKFKCWGKAYIGEFGTGIFVQPVVIGDSAAEMGNALKTGASNADVTQIAMGDFHTCILTQGAIKCTGSNSVGECGIGSAKDVGAYNLAVKLA